MFAYMFEMYDLPCNFGNKTMCEMGCHQKTLNIEQKLLYHFDPDGGLAVCLSVKESTIGLRLFSNIINTFQ